MQKKEMLFHQTNASFQIEWIPLHLPYNSDLVPSDYWLFVDLKRILQG